MSRPVVFPILEQLQDIYRLAKPMDRYWAYVHLMTEKYNDILPLGDFSPMGLRQAEFIDQLLDMEAEKSSQGVLEKSRDVPPAHFVLVVMDEPKNGWTQRHLTDFEYRFAALEKFNHHKNQSLWVPIYLWTTDTEMKPTNPTPEWVESETLAAITRLKWKSLHGVPATLKQMIDQENSVRGALRKSEIIMKSVDPAYLASNDFIKQFSIMYGDEASRTVGYCPLGLEGLLND